MAKTRVDCPECGHRFTADIQGMKTIGVRARRITGNQFEYSIAAPEGVTASGEFATVTEDLILSSALAIPFGAAFGFLSSVVAPDYVVQFVGIGGCAGLGLAWGWLCAEHNQRLKRVLPWFWEQRAAWSVGSQTTDGVELTIDHRYRDGNTEAGRTIQYFGVLPVEVERFSEWAVAVLGTDTLPGKSLAIDNWIGSEGLFSRKDYEALLDLLRKTQAVVKRKGNIGNILTGGGRRALRNHLRAHPPTPAGSVHDA